MQVPHVIMPRALPEDVAERLRAYAFEHAGAMAPGRVGQGAADRLDPSMRNVLVARDLRPLRPEMEALAKGWLPQVLRPLGLKPSEVGRIGLSLVAYGDGAFYRRHVDTHVGATDGSPHEVLPVSCPGGDLADYRFGLNVWVHGPASTGTP